MPAAIEITADKTIRLIKVVRGLGWPAGRFGLDRIGSITGSATMST